MRRRQGSQDEHHSPLAIKLAWWAGFLATLALVFALAQAQSARALTAPAAGPTFSVLEDEGEFGFELEVEEGEGDESDDEDWEYEYEEEECEFLGEDEEEEEELCDEAEIDEGVPSECRLSRAEATVSAVPARGTVRVAVRYAAESPAAVKVEYWLRGGKGPLRLGRDRARFNRKGVFRSSERLSERQMAKVAAARSFVVELQAVNTPGYCHRYFDQKLTVRRASGAALTWSEPPARTAARARR